MVDIPTKRCVGCSERFPLEEFEGGNNRAHCSECDRTPPRSIVAVLRKWQEARDRLLEHRERGTATEFSELQLRLTAEITNDLLNVVDRPPREPLDGFLTTTQAAAELGFTREGVRVLVHKGYLKEHWSALGPVYREEDVRRLDEKGWPRRQAGGRKRKAAS